MIHKLSLRFLLSYFGVVILAICSSSLYAHYRLRSYFVQNLEQDLYRTGHVIAALIGSQPIPENMDTLCIQLKEQSGLRVTFIGVDGTVLGDSDKPSSTMENHLYRPEVQAAIEKGVGSNIHFSYTLGYPMLYGAIRASAQGKPIIIRLSVPLQRVLDDLATVRSSIIQGSLLAFVLAIPVLYLFSSTMSRRVRRLRDFVHAARNGDSSSRLYIGSRDELGQLEKELDEVAESLNRHVQELTIERKRLKTIVEAIQDGIVLLDIQDRIVFINPSAAKILDLAVESSLGQRLLEVVRSKELFDLVQDARKEKPSLEAKEMVLLKDPDKTYLASASGLREPSDGVLMGCLVLLRNITEQKRLDKIRADFVSHVSHGLRTPLTLIKGYIETLQVEGFKNEEQAERFLSIIAENTNGLVQMVNDLLRLSSIELGRLPMRKEPVHLKELIAKTSRAFEARATEQGLMLLSSLPEDLPPVLVDPDRLAEILVNLYDNAIKYTDKGEIRASAEYLPPGAGQPGARVSLSISDTGIGIPAREIPRVTERFYRCERQAPQEDRSSGLGLAIVKHLVKLMEGELSITSKEHVGTTVIVNLPVYSEDIKGSLG
jgi:two-component system phosphate regulon sensor histidine kinase PhoR